MLNLVGVAASACILNGSSSSCMLFPFHILCNRTPSIWPRGVFVHATFSLKGCHYSLSSHKFHLFKIKSQHCESSPHDSSAFSFTQSETNNNSGSRSSDDNGISNKSTISSSSGDGDGDDDAKEPTSKKPQNNSWKMPQWNWNWNWKRGGHGLIQIWGLAFQLSLLFLFMKLLRPGLPILASRKPQTPLIDTTGVPAARVNVSFSEFLQRIKRNHVQRVEIDGVHFTFSLRPEAEEGVDQGLEIQNPLIDHEGDLLALAQLGHLVPLTRKTIYTTTKPSDITTPYDKMIQDGVEFGAPDKRSGRLISSISLALLYVVLVVGLLVHLPFKFPQLTGHFHRRNRKGGNSKQSTCLVTFADVAGVDEAKEELEEIVEYLRTPDRFSRLGARPPRGVLLVGLPGTGKTLLAKAVAGEADVPFISCSASEFVELYVGMGASRVRDLFIKAKKDAPSIVFIDEIDAVAKGRDGRLRSVSNDEREQTLNQLLTELDGFESNSTVIVLAATNRADVLDPALRRPGRFDRIVTVDPPDRRGREEILQVHAVKKQVPLASDVDLGQVAAVTSGFTGADLANLVNEAALLAGRAGKSEVHKEEFTSAIERSIAGIEKKRSTLHGNEKGVVARHEAGHAVVGTAIATLLPSHVHIEKLSILPRSGGTLGFTYLSSGNEDRYLLFVDEIRGRLVTLLGGRAAEEVIYCGRVSTGALDDIKQATDVAYKAVAEYGLSSCIGPISLATLSGGGLDDSGVAFPRTKDQGHVTDLVQREVRALLLSAFEMALLVIRSNPTVLEGLGAQLEAEEKVEGERLQDWLNNVVAPAELAAFIKGDARLF